MAKHQLFDRERSDRDRLLLKRQLLCRLTLSQRLMLQLHWLPQPAARTGYRLLRMPHWRAAFVALALAALLIAPSLTVPVLIGGINPLASGPGTGPWWTQDLPVGTSPPATFPGPNPWADITNPTWGADPTGAVNSTVQIQNAITAMAAVNGVVFIPKGQFLVTAAATPIFNIPKPIHVSGTGLASILLVKTGTAATVDVIRISPATATTTDASGALFNDFRIAAQSGNPARHAFRLEPIVANAFIRQFQIQRCWTDKLGGNSVSVANTGGTANGAIFGCQFEDNFFSSGLDFTGGGDSISCVRNTICNIADGTDAGAVTVNLVAGAGQFVFEGNNFTGAGGFQLLSGIGTRIHGNNMQLQYTGSGPNSAFVNVVGGGLAGVTTTTITNNICTVLAGGGAYDALRLNTTNNWIEGNYFLAQAGRTNLVITATGALTFIGYGNSYNGAAAAILDNGPSTFSVGPTGIITTPGGITFAGNNPRIRGGVADLGFLNHAGAVQNHLINDNGDQLATRGVAFWGHAAVAAQPAAPVTLADVIAIIRGCGLSA